MSLFIIPISGNDQIF